MSDATDKAREVFRSWLAEQSETRQVGEAMADYIDTLEGPMWVCDKCDFATNDPDHSFAHCFDTGHAIGNEAHAEAKREFEEAISE